MNEITNSNGTVIKVGDWVWFKADVEQSGQVESISTFTNYGCGSNANLHLVNPDRFSGDYIGGQTKATINADHII